jgi:hypothetical protein
VCDGHLTRRESLFGAALGGAAALAGAFGARPTTAVAAVPAVEVMPGLSILPRDAWGADLPPKAASQRETVRFLLVHHTASSNNYSSARTVIRNTYAWQTSAAKGWPDVCYQFFIGRDGDVWEGRAGALSGPVIADATGGNQGYAQLACLLGDFTSVAPAAAAIDSLVKVLAWMADRYSIDTDAGATTSFVSRGSNRWPAGSNVTTSTIAGHRDMSATSCPGDHLYGLVADLHERVSAQRAEWSTVLKPAVRLGRVNAQPAP